MSDHWIERAQSAEAKLQTLKDQFEPVVDRVQRFKTNFGVKEASNGEISIDYVKLVTNLGMDGAMELRKVIDETYHVKGDAGEKPHIKLANG